MTMSARIIRFASSKPSCMDLTSRKLDLREWELLAVDGARIKAVNKDRDFTRASLTEFIKLEDAKLEDYLIRSVSLTDACPKTCSD
jgi:hypothetical protein